MRNIMSVLLPFLGMVAMVIGYGPLSLKKHPTAGVGFVVAGFVFRLAGLLVFAGYALLFLYVLISHITGRA